MASRIASSTFSFGVSSRWALTMPVTPHMSAFPSFGESDGHSRRRRVVALRQYFVVKRRVTCQHRGQAEALLHTLAPCVTTLAATRLVFYIAAQCVCQCN